MTKRAGRAGTGLSVRWRWAWLFPQLQGKGGDFSLIRLSF